MPSNYGGMSKLEMSKKLETQALTIAIQDETIQCLREAENIREVRRILSEKAKRQFHQMREL